MWHNILKSSLSLSLCSTIVYLILTSLSFWTSVDYEWPNPFWIFFCFYKWFPGHLGIETQYVKISAPPVSVENFLLWTPLVSRSPPTWSLSIWFWSIAIQAFHWLRQILLCQSSRLGQLKITHSFEVNLDIFIKNKFFNWFFPENNHIWRKVKEKGSSPKLISPFLDPICRLRSLQPSKNKSPWASRPKHFMNVTGAVIRLVIMLMISSSD